MSDETDGPEGISEEELASIADISRSRRREWARRGWLRIAASRRGYEELDAVELAAFTALARVVDLTDAALIWEQVRPDLASSFTKRPLLLIADLRRRRGAFAFELADVGALVLGGDPFRVLELSGELEHARETYARLQSGGRRR